MPGCELYVGPMYAGKTTSLIRRVEEERAHGKACIVLKWDGDSRYSADEVTSHNGKKLLAVNCKALMTIIKKCLSFEVIAIDEGQFFPDIDLFVRELLGEGKTVLISALDGDYHRAPFGNVMRLIPLCMPFEKMVVICGHTPAPFSMRTSKSDLRVLIGSNNDYRSVSRQEFFGNNQCNGEIFLVLGPHRCGKSAILQKELSMCPNSPSILLRGRIPSQSEIKCFKTVVLRKVFSLAGLSEFADSAANQGKHVLVSSYEGDQRSGPSEEILKLIPLCDRYLKLGPSM